MLRLVLERYPVMLRVPPEHRCDHQQRHQQRRPDPRLQQQARAITQQQAQHNRHCQQHGGVFGQARQPQGQPQQQPPAPVGQSRLPHHMQGQRHGPDAQGHEQGVGHQTDAQHVDDRGQRKGRQGPQARFAPDGLQARGDVEDAPGAEQPQDAGQGAGQPDRRVQRHQRPLDPAHQRWVVKVTPVRVRGVEQVMRLVHRQADGRANGQVEQRQGQQDQGHSVDQGHGVGCQRRGESAAGAAGAQSKRLCADTGFVARFAGALPKPLHRRELTRIVHIRIVKSTQCVAFLSE